MKAKIKTVMNIVLWWSLPSGVILAETLEPAIPIGKLHIGSTIVMKEDTPILTWETTHPQTISDVVDVGGAGGE